MRLSKYILIALMSFTFVCGGVTGGLEPEGQAATAILGSVSSGDGSGNCDVPPTWKGPIRGKARWVPTYVDKHGKPQAYCDRQTGIVIQGTPGTPGTVATNCDNGNPCPWSDALFYCANLIVGDSGQKGWRLLYMQELAALADINSKSCTNDNLCLPDGHPFKDVQSNFYWSASTYAPQSDAAWIVDFSIGFVAPGSKVGTPLLAWCGRGASAADAY